MGKEFIEPKCRKCGFVFEAEDSEREDLNGELYMNCPNCKNPVNRDFHMTVEETLKLKDTATAEIISKNEKI